MSRRGEDSGRSLTSLRRKRGVIKRSITRVVNSMKTLEGTPDDPGTVDHARQLIIKLEGFDKDFRSVQFEIVDLFEEEESEALEKEHEELDRHEDEVTAATLRLQRLVTPRSSLSTDAGAKKLLSRKLTRVERRLKETEAALASTTEGPDNVPLLEQHTEQLTDVKKELSSIYDELISLDVPDDSAVVDQHTKLEKLRFDCALRVKQLLNAHTSSHPSASTACTSGNASKLPKLDVPTFNGDILQWQCFWEQFEVSVHSRSSLMDAEKLVYLQQAMKHGSARNAIEGLSRSGGQYAEAVECLKMRYSRPRLIHRAHVRSIVDTSPFKDGSGKELRRLHDTLQQHLRALKAMKSEPDPSFVTSVVELKLDTTTLFEWQKHSQDKTEVPHYQFLLEFLDLRAQASESLVRTAAKRNMVSLSTKKPPHPGKTASFAASTESGCGRCVVCALDHSLYSCSKFKEMSHEDRLSTLKLKNLCINCLGSGHFLKQCKSSHRCKKCQRPHHTLLHAEPQGKSNSDPPVTDPSGKTTPDPVVSNVALKLKASPLLMTCRILVFAPGGSSVEARALLDNGSTSSFVTERLVQSLRLPRSQQTIRVSGITGSTDTVFRSVASLQVSSAHFSGRRIDLTPVVLPKITCDLPVSPVPFDLSWNHLDGLPLADPAFGEPQRVDVLLGADIFADILLHGRRTGPPGSPVAMETEFGWVLCGGNTDKSSVAAVNLQVTSLHVSAVGTDDILRKFWEIEESAVDPPVLSLEERSVVQHFEANHSRTKAGRFVVPLPRRPDSMSIGESRSQALRRLLSLERSLRHKGRFQDVDDVMQEYLTLGHAEAVPIEDMNQPPASVFTCPCMWCSRIQVPPRRSERYSTLQQSRLREYPSMTPCLLDQRFILHYWMSYCDSECIASLSLRM